MLTRAEAAAKVAGYLADVRRWRLGPPHPSAHSALQVIWCSTPEDTDLVKQEYARAVPEPPERGSRASGRRKQSARVDQEQF